MKTKLSKRILSVLLAALMVITSIPLVTVTAFAADVAVTEVQDVMSEFDDMLATAGQFTNVTPAYNAYVDCQKALDAYIYGGETDALNGKAQALRDAMAGIGTFTGYTGTAVPTFPTSTADNMKEYVGVGYNNVLYAPEATAITTSGAQGGVIHQVYYAANAVLLYDGTNSVILPVMLSANKDASSAAYNKDRYIWGCYPSDSSYNDDANWGFTEQWNSGNGTDANWNWNWWSGKYNGVASHAGYNKATAYDSYSTSMRSGAIPANSRSGFIVYTYYAGSPLFMSNALKLKTTPADYGQEYTLTWFTATGASANDDKSLVTASSPIKVVNYKTLTDAIATNGNKMKSISLDSFGEGGLLAYVTAMDAATAFNPNTYFTSGDGYTTCVEDMKTAVSNMNNASTTTTDSTAYNNLRAAMDAKMAVYGDGTNNGYTEESWSNFVDAWNNAKAIMSTTNDANGGYTDPNGAQAAADALNAVVLETEVDKVDTSALEAVIDTFAGYTNIFTAETYSAAVAVIAAAKTAVWSSEDLYKDAASALDLVGDNQNIVNNWVTEVENAIKALRINPDAVVLTAYGRYSINSAVALQNEIADPTDYSNYSAFQAAVNNATELYIPQLPNTDLTDYTNQYAEYVAQIEAIVSAYENLTYSFTKLPDGTIASAGTTTSITTLEDHKNSNNYNWWIDFDYPTNAIVFRTTHNASTVRYGDANLTFKINIDNNISKENNALDSITLNSTVDANIQINSAWATSTPNALSDDQKATYAGCLSYNGFSLTDFRVVGQMNNVKSYYGTTASGSSVTDTVSPTDEFTKILATTEGSGNNPALGTIALQPTEKGDASITLAADMNIDVPATEEVELSETTLPSSTVYTLSGTYFGATYVWNTQPDVAYSGYEHLTTKTNDQQLFSAVTVIDISNLVDLVNICNAKLKDSAMYTEETWSEFETQLGLAQADMDYTSLTATVILNRCKTRYSNLWTALQGLEVKQLPVTFNYKDANGADVSKVITAEYGKTITDYAEQFNAIVPASYISADGLYTYTFNGTWSPDLDLDAPIKVAATYTANYDEDENLADFTAYNTARAQLLGALVDEVYTVADLNAIKAATDAMTYFNMSETEKGQLMGSVQPSINDETAAIVALKDGLTAASIDASTARAAAELAKASQDEDVYDITDLNFEYTETVIIGDQSVVGLKFGTQDELDAAIADILNNLSKCVYTVYLNGVAVGTAEYGTPVIVGSDGQFAVNVSDMDSADYDGSTMVAWSYSYSAPSRDGQQSTPKYALTAKSLGFIVKGDTYLTTAQATSDEAGYVVKFMTNGGKIFDVQYTTDGTVTMPAAPNYAYYTFTGYDNGLTAGQTLTVSADTTVTANYEADTSNTYSILFFDGIINWNQLVVANESDHTYNYNELVEFSSTNAYCWASAVYHDEDYSTDLTLLAYGTDYSFYACHSYDNDMYEGIVAISEADYKSIISSDTDGYVLYDGSGNEIKATIDPDTGRYVYPDPISAVSVLEEVVPVYDESGKFTKFSMIGSFALPEGYSIVEAGILFTSNQAADLTVENVGTNGIARYKAASYSCGNQFVINVKAPSSGAAVSFKYASYAIVKDDLGNLTTLYSKSILGSTDEFI